MSAVNHSQYLDIPERVRLKAMQTSPQTRQWLNDLPALVAQIEQAWRIKIGKSLPGGTSAYVSLARSASGADAVLKLDMPGGDFQNEIDTIVRAEGLGYVEVLQFDGERRAMLLEQLGPSMQELQLPPEKAIPLLVETLERAWLVTPGAHQTVTAGDYKANTLARLITDLWEKLDYPCSEQIVLQALEFARRRADAFGLNQCVLVHGDPHYANALAVKTPRAGAESGFVFVDPDGFLCAPEYDLGVVLRDWCKELLAAPDPMALAHSYCRLLADESGLEEASIWEWGYIERVSSGLYVYAHGSKDHAQPFFDSAQRLIGS